MPHDRLMAELLEITNASKKMLQDQQPFHPICAEGHECVGWGVDGTTGKPTPFPIVHLSYDPSRTDKKYHGLSEPLEVQSNHVVNPVWGSVDGTTMAYSQVDEFVNHVDSKYAGATPAPKGTSGIYSRDFADVFNEYFQRSDDRALSVSRSSRKLIQMKLPVDPTTNTRKYHLDRHANDFINALPPTYTSDGDKKQFRLFIDNYGTSYATSATLGGRVEQYALWKTWLVDARLGAFTEAMLSKNAAIDFYKTTGLPGSGGGSHDSGYTSETSLQPLHCEGGDSTISCQSNFEKWAASLTEAPILLDFELAPISDLVEDPGTKKALESAVQDYVKERKAAWAAYSKCPHSCGGVGSCGSGGSVCTCTRPGRVGRMCSGCAPVSVKGTFVDIMGKEHSGVATVACNGQFVAAWTGNGQCIVNDDGAGGTCPNGGAAMAYCARTSDGSLITKVEQKQCTALGRLLSDTQSDNSEYEETTGRIATERRRRLLNMRGRSEKDSGGGTILTKKKKKKDAAEYPCGGFSATSNGGSTSAKEADKYRHCPPCVTGQHNKPCKVTSRCEYA